MTIEKLMIEKGPVGLPGAPMQPARTDGCGGGCSQEAARAADAGHDHCGCGGAHEADTDCSCGENCSCGH